MNDWWKSFSIKKLGCGKLMGRYFGSGIYILCSPCNMEQNRLRSSLKNLFCPVFVLIKTDEEEADQEKDIVGSVRSFLRNHAPL